jgi:spore coat polysaccharide biosynthesis predicted glycosyltransferase SpsG
MKNKSILFITNGNSNIGYGHISRSKIIAEEFCENGYDTFFMLPEKCPFINQVLDQTKNISLVSSFEEESVKPVIFNLVEKYKIEIVVIDLIEREYNKFEWLRINFKELLLVTITLFLFENSERYEHVSFFPRLKEYQGMPLKAKHGKLKFYSGPQYLAFRKEFEHLKKQTRRNGNKVLITMGGSDPCNLTLKTLQAIIYEEYETTVLLSQAANSYSEVKALISRGNCIRLIERSENISQLMLQHDILIINGGLTRYESCLTQTPFIAISIHEEQYNITQEFVELGIGINLGIGKKLSLEEIRYAVESLLNDYHQRCQMSNKMKDLFDVYGSKRIFERILEAKNNLV